MAPPTENVLIFGATGVIGRYITDAIVNAQPPFKRIGIYTSADTVEKKAAEIQSLKDKGVEVIAGDFKDDYKILGTFKGPGLPRSPLSHCPSCLLNHEQIDSLYSQSTTPSSAQWAAMSSPSRST